MLSAVNELLRIGMQILLKLYPLARGLANASGTLKPVATAKLSAFRNSKVARMAATQAVKNVEFERHGYFVADRVDHAQCSKPVFNLAAGLLDSCGK